jgi:hypothetical protein
VKLSVEELISAAAPEPNLVLSLEAELEPNLVLSRSKRPELLKKQK